MILLYRIKCITILSVLICLGVLNSCTKDDDDSVPNRVQLLSFGPSGAQPGEKMSLIGNHLERVTAIELVGATISKEQFVSQSSEVIEITIPMTAEAGFVKLKTTEGDVMSVSRLNLLAPVVITSIPETATAGDNITITGQYLNWVNSITFGKDVVVTQFVSKAVDKLVVTVPRNAQTGSLIFSSGGTEPLIIESEQSLGVTLPTITGIAPIPVAKGGNLTITGTNLQLVQGVWFKGVATIDSAFVSRSATELVIKIPDGASKGKVAINTYSDIKIESTMGIQFIGDDPDLAPLAYTIYGDKLEGNWQDWGWKRTASYDNTDFVRDGEKSIKCQFTAADGGIKFANASVSAAGYTEFAIAVYGGTGSNGVKLKISPAGGVSQQITLQEGKWVEYKLKLSDMGSPANITDVMIENGSYVGTIYVDHVGLR